MSSGSNVNQAQTLTFDSNKNVLRSTEAAWVAGGSGALCVSSGWEWPAGVVPLMVACSKRPTRSTVSVVQLASGWVFFWFGGALPLLGRRLVGFAVRKKLLGGARQRARTPPSSFRRALRPALGVRSFVGACSLASNWDRAQWRLTPTADQAQAPAGSSSVRDVPSGRR